MESKSVSSIMMTFGTLILCLGILAVVMKEIYLLEEIIREIGLFMIPIGFGIVVMGAFLSE